MMNGSRPFNSLNRRRVKECCTASIILIALVYGNAFDEGGPVGLRCADGLAAAQS